MGFWTVIFSVYGGGNGAITVITPGVVGFAEPTRAVGYSEPTRAVGYSEPTRPVGQS